MVSEYNWMYKKEQDKIWRYIKNQLNIWKEHDYPDPTIYFTDGLTRWIALRILEEIKLTENVRKTK